MQFFREKLAHLQGKLLCPRTHFLAHVSFCVPKIWFLGAAGPQTSSKGPVQGVIEYNIGLGLLLGIAGEAGYYGILTGVRTKCAP